MVKYHSIETSLNKRCKSFTDLTHVFVHLCKSIFSEQKIQKCGSNVKACYIVCFSRNKSYLEK